MLERLSQSRCHIVMVIHCNHANELDAPTAEYLQRARAAGVTLLNQAVLLKGVNDTLNAQVQLSQRLFASGVLPYYLPCVGPRWLVRRISIVVSKQRLSFYWSIC